MTLSEDLHQLNEQKKAIEARIAEVYRLSIQAPEAEKVCADWLAEELSEPWPRGGALGWHVDHVSWIRTGEWYQPSLRGASKYVSVRPCAKEHEGKTFLGVLVGDIATAVSCTYNPESRTLNLAPALSNPAIFVPRLGQIIMGRASWWGALESEDDLRAISDEDIDGIWYVQALRLLSGNATVKPGVGEA